MIPGVDGAPRSSAADTPEEQRGTSPVPRELVCRRYPTSLSLIMPSCHQAGAEAAVSTPAGCPDRPGPAYDPVWAVAIHRQTGRQPWWLLVAMVTGE